MKLKKHFLLVALFSVLALTVVFTSCNISLERTGGSNTADSSGDTNAPNDNNTSGNTSTPDNTNTSDDNNSSGDNGNSGGGSTQTPQTREVFGFFGPEWFINSVMKFRAGETYKDPDDTTAPAVSDPTVTNSMRAADRVAINVMSFISDVPGMIEEYQMSSGADWALNTTIIATTDGMYQPALNDMLADGEVDIFAAEAAFVLDYSKGDISKYAAPYEDFIEDFDNKLKDADIAEYTSTIGSNDEGKIIALGYQSNGCCFIYRRSIAKKVFGTDNPERIGEIIGAKTGSWDKFFEAAAKCKEKGYAMISGLDDIYLMIDGFSNGWLDENNKLCIDEKQEAYLDIAKRIIENGWSNNTQTWIEAWDADMRGKNGTYGDWAVCLPPTGAFWGGTWIFATQEAIANPAKKAIVADIIEYLTLDTTDKGWLYKWATGTRWNLNIGYSDSITKDSVASAVVMQNVDGTSDFCGGQDIHKVYAQADKMVDGTKMTAYDNTINSFWRGLVREYAEGHKTKEEVIKELKDKVKAEFEEIVID